MVTFNGIECHNEWEITFMELHRNGAIAHAVFDYVTYTGEEGYLVHEGLDVLCGIARFWTGRVHLNARTGQYMIHLGNHIETDYDFTTGALSFNEHKGASLAGHVLVTLSLNYKIAKLWGFTRR
jgi:hypothetical protein